MGLQCSSNIEYVSRGIRVTVTSQRRKEGLDRVSLLTLIRTSEEKMREGKMRQDVRRKEETRQDKMR